MDQEDTSLLSRYPAPPRRLLTVDEYHRMGEVGILTKDDRVELIEGELVTIAPIGAEHADAVSSLTSLLAAAVGDRGRVSPQNPVRLNLHGEPQPDFAILRPRVPGQPHRLPQPDDVLLAIEVADSSLATDRGLKRALYARNGIRELWIVNLKAFEVEVCRNPSGESYSSVTRAGRADILEIEALPGARIPVDRIFD